MRVEELQPFACKELVALNPCAVVQARYLELATIGIVVGASLVNYRAGTPPPTLSEGPARLSHIQRYMRDAQPRDGRARILCGRPLAS